MKEGETNTVSLQDIFNTNQDEWKLTIKKVNNGYVLKGKSGEDYKEIVIQEQDIDKYDEQRTMVDLLLDIKDFFGVNSSKHNKINCRVTLENEE